MIELITMSNLVDEMKFYKEHYIKTITQENSDLRAKLEAAEKVVEALQLIMKDISRTVDLSIDYADNKHQLGIAISTVISGNALEAAKHAIGMANDTFPR